MLIPNEITNSLNQFTKKTPLSKYKVEDLLQHDFWQRITTPSYDVNASHLPSDVNPEDSSDWFDFFWPDSILKYIATESNKYIQKKNKDKNRKHKINSTSLTEL